MTIYVNSWFRIHNYPARMHEGKAISFVCCRLSAQKSPDFDILASDKSVSTTKQSKAVKNFTLNHIARLTGTTNHVFSVGHAYQPHL